MPPVNVAENGMRLAAAPQARKVEMHPDHAEGNAIDPNVREDSAPRFQRGKMENLAVEDLDVFLNEKRVAVPADAPGADAQRDWSIIAMFFDQVEGQGAGPASEPAVRFLECNDVGIEFVEDFDGAIRAAPSVGPDGLTHVVTGDAKHRGLIVDLA